MKRPSNFDELLYKAQHEPNLPDAMRSCGFELKSIGRVTNRGSRRFVTSGKSGVSGDLSSVSFYLNADGTWIAIDHRARGGDTYLDAIGIMRELCNMSFDEAVYALSSTASPTPYVNSPPLSERRQSTEIELPPVSNICVKQIIGYLVNGRNIPYDVVYSMLRQELMYSSMYSLSPNGEKKPFLVFPITDKDGTCVGADMCRASTYIKLKSLSPGSSPMHAWGFKYMTERIESGTPLYFCESAIDAISLFCLYGKENKPGVYLSMAGLKDITLEAMTDKLGGTPIICADNDEAGKSFRKRHESIQALIPNGAKDWNEILQSTPPDTFRFNTSAIRPLYVKGSKVQRLQL